MIYILFQDCANELRDKLANQEHINQEARKQSARHMTQVGRALLAFGLRTYYNIELSDIRINKLTHGKPYLEGISDIHFNISHSGTMVVCAIGDEPIGIDIEQKQYRDHVKIARKIMNPQEWEEYQLSDDKTTYFYQTWVKKESYLKWTGEGITSALSNIEYQGYGKYCDIHKDYICAFYTETRPTNIIYQNLTCK